MSWTEGKLPLLTNLTEIVVAHFCQRNRLQETLIRGKYIVPMRTDSTMSHRVLSVTTYAAFSFYFISLVKPSLPWAKSDPNNDLGLR